MRIKLIKNGIPNLNKKKEYEVISECDKFYTIKNDMLSQHAYRKELFTVIVKGENNLTENINCAECIEEEFIPTEIDIETTEQEEKTDELSVRKNKKNKKKKL